MPASTTRRTAVTVLVVALLGVAAQPAIAGTKGRARPAPSTTTTTAAPATTSTTAKPTTTTAPSSPTATNVRVSSTSSSTATLSWGAPSGGASGYVVGRDGTDSTGYGAYQSGTLSSSTTSFQFGYLVPGATYNLWVQPTGGTKTTVSVTMPASSTAAPSTTTTTAPPTTTTTVPSSTSVKVGAYVGPAQASQIATFASHTQSNVTVAVDFLDMTRDWSQISSPNWVLDPWTTWLKADPSRKLVLSVPMLINSAKGQFDNTSYDTYHRQLAQNIANRGIASQVIIRLGWEMNGTWFPWSTSADGYKRMWRRLIPIYRSVSSGFKYDWCVSGGSPSPESWYPGDDVVDIVGMDQYDIVWQSPGGDPNWRWSKILPNYQWQANFAAAHGKPASIDEWSLWTASDTTQGGGGDNPTFINNVAAWAASHRYLHVAYFNSSSGGPGMTLEQAPNGIQAFRNNY